MQTPEQIAAELVQVEQSATDHWLVCMPNAARVIACRTKETAEANAETIRRMVSAGIRQGFQPVLEMACNGRHSNNPRSYLETILGMLQASGASLPALPEALHGPFALNDPPRCQNLPKSGHYSITDTLTGETLKEGTFHREWRVWTLYMPVVLDRNTTINIKTDARSTPEPHGCVCGHHRFNHTQYGCVCGGCGCSVFIGMGQVADAVPVLEAPKVIEETQQPSARNPFDQTPEQDRWRSE